jgi:hypothetical protein
VLPDDPSGLLKLLNEDLFRGVLTDVPFVSDNKAPREWARAKAHAQHLFQCLEWLRYASGPC